MAQVNSIRLRACWSQSGEKDKTFGSGEAGPNRLTNSRSIWSRLFGFYELRSQKRGKLRQISEKCQQISECYGATDEAVETTGNRPENTQIDVGSST